MKIWWCQEHQIAQLNETDACDKGYELAETDTCRVVPMRLIPDNVETVIRETIRSFDEGNYMGPGAADALIDLVLAALDGETP